MSAKEDLLNRAAQEYKAFYEAIAGLNEEHLVEAWLGNWSIRDVAAHIVGWHREMTPALERMARGERPIPAGVSYDDTDTWNERFASAMRHMTVADVLLEFDKSHEVFLHAAAGVPEERFQQGKTAYKIVDMNSAHHYKEHGDQIRAWRASRGL
jgi:hypothetical protein